MVDSYPSVEGDGTNLATAILSVSTIADIDYPISNSIAAYSAFGPNTTGHMRQSPVDLVAERFPYTVPTVGSGSRSGLDSLPRTPLCRSLKGARMQESGQTDQYSPLLQFQPTYLGFHLMLFPDPPDYAANTRQSNHCPRHAESHGQFLTARRWGQILRETGWCICGYGRKDGICGSGIGGTRCDSRSWRYGQDLPCKE